MGDGPGVGVETGLGLLAAGHRGIPAPIAVYETPVADKRTCTWGCALQFTVVMCSDKGEASVGACVHVGDGTSTGYATDRTRQELGYFIYTVTGQSDIPTSPQSALDIRIHIIYTQQQCNIPVEGPAALWVKKLHWQ